MKTTQTRTGTYKHLPDRDILADLAKTEHRKWRHRQGSYITPVFPTQNQYLNRDSVQLRFINHLIERMNRAPGSIDVHLFATAKPQTVKLNQAVREFARDHPGRINLINVDPADWATS